MFDVLRRTGAASISLCSAALPFQERVAGQLKPRPFTGVHRRGGPAKHGESGCLPPVQGSVRLRAGPGHLRRHCPADVCGGPSASSTFQHHSRPTAVPTCGNQQFMRPHSCHKGRPAVRNRNWYRRAAQAESHGNSALLSSTSSATDVRSPRRWNLRYQHIITSILGSATAICIRCLHP